MNHLSGTPLNSTLLALTKNIRLGREGLPGVKNTLAYYNYSYITNVRSFIALVPG
jgi:hypothetical protein